MTKRKVDSIALLSLYNNYSQQQEEEEDDDNCREENGAAQAEEKDIIIHDDVDQETEKIVLFPFATCADAPRASVIQPAAAACQDTLGLGLVEYAHEDVDVDVSPEAKGQEEVDAGGVILKGRDVLVAVSEKIAHARFSQKEKPLERTSAGNSHEEARVGRASPSGKDISFESSEVAEQAANALKPRKDLFGGFLPLPPSKKCSDELQMKLTKYLRLKSQGRSFNTYLRGLKDYRNPDFLQRVVKHLGIDPLGSLFRKDIFDPHNLDVSDFYDALLAQQRKPVERKEQGKRKVQKVALAHRSLRTFSEAAVQPSDDRTNPIAELITAWKTSSSQSLTGNRSTHATAYTHVLKSSSDGYVKMYDDAGKKRKWDKVYNETYDNFA